MSDRLETAMDELVAAASNELGAKTLQELQSIKGTGESILTALRETKESNDAKLNTINQNMEKPQKGR